MPAPLSQYDEIELRLVPGPTGFTVHASAHGADAHAPFDLQAMSRQQIEDLVLYAITPRRRRIDSGALGEVTTLGGTLFDALVRDDVRDLYRGAAARADATGHGLRVKLSLSEARELRGLPWELMYDEASFLVLDLTTPVVRSLDLPLIHEPLKVQPPLRILGVVSSPKGVPALDVAQERLNVEKGLKELTGSGAVSLRWLERATLPALLDVMREDTFHVLHFIGHGEFDEAAADCVLLMEDDDGFARRVSSRRLGQVMRGHDSLRLAVINACEGGRDAVDDPFAGIAGSLLQQGIPAVVAMQFEITDRAAVLFSRDLYDALANGYPIDAAVAEARKAIWADDNDIEWATPVLFMRAADGRLFDVQAPPRGPASAVTEATTTTRSPSTLQPAAGDATDRPADTAATTGSGAARSGRPAVSRRVVLVAAAAAVLLIAAIGVGISALRGGTGSTDGWQRLPDLPVALEAAGVAPYDGRVWVAGGVAAAEGRAKLSRVDVYDPGTRSWSRGPELPVALDHAALVATSRQLFLLGGISASGSVATVYRLDSPTGTWQADVPLPAPRGAGAATWDGGRIVFGGGVGPDGHAAADVWALEGGAWRPLGHLQRAREKLAVATDGYGTVWFMAGRDPNDQANAFPYVDVVQASAVKPAGEVSAVQGPAGVWWPGAGACMVAGQSADAFTGSLDCLGATPKAPALTPGRAGLGTAVLDGTLYAAGGYATGVNGSRTLESLRLPAAGGGS